MGPSGAPIKLKVAGSQMTTRTSAGTHGEVYPVYLADCLVTLRLHFAVSAQVADTTRYQVRVLLAQIAACMLL